MVLARDHEEADRDPLMPTWEIAVETSLSAKHKLRGVPAKHGHLHAHRWTVRAVVRAKTLTKAGWVVDLGELKDALDRVIKPYADRFLNELSPFDSLNPTREKIARVLAESLAAELKNLSTLAHVHRIDISEGAHWVSYIDD